MLLLCDTGFLGSENNGRDAHHVMSWVPQEQGRNTTSVKHFNLMKCNKQKTFLFKSNQVVNRGRNHRETVNNTPQTIKMLSQHIDSVISVELKNKKYP